MTRPLKIALYFLLFFTVFNFTSSIMGGSYIVSALGGSHEIGLYGVSFFGLGNACLLPATEALEKRYGRIQVLMFFLACFGIFTALCGCAPTFFTYVLFRFLAGASSAAFLPLSVAAIMDHASQEQKVRTLAIVGVLTTVTPVLGACFGGVVAYDLNWPWIFFPQIPFFLVIYAILHLHKTPHIAGEPPSFDKVGYCAYILAITSIVTAFSLGQELDWFRSPTINVLLSSSAIFLVFFILWEWNHEHPLMDLKLFKNSVFSVAIFSLFFLFSAYFGMILLLSLWLQIDANYTPRWIALLLGHMAIVGGILFVALERHFEKVVSLWSVSGAIAFFAISCFYSTAFNVEVDFFRLAIARSLAGVGLGFFLFPLLQICLRNVPLPSVSHGFSLFHSVRLLAGSLGCVVYPTLWIRRRVFYHDRLGEQLTIYTDQTKNFFSQVSFLGASQEQSYGFLGEALEQQSDALALADCFYLMGWIMLFLLTVVVGYLLRPFLLRSKIFSRFFPSKSKV